MLLAVLYTSLFFFNPTPTPEIYTLSLHDALPIYDVGMAERIVVGNGEQVAVNEEDGDLRSEEHTSELQSRLHLVCRLLLEKKKTACSSSTRPYPAAARML